ncbi:MAG: nucleotide pyrophosphatase [Caldiserica bacterium]|nr:nucleotide pyrophosphatase [Caldisericota bacterium]
MIGERKTSYYIGPGLNLVFTSLSALLAIIMAILASLLVPFRFLFRFFRRNRKVLYAIIVFIFLVLVATMLRMKSVPEMKYGKIIILGMDGLDARRVEEMMKRGELPNFQKLKNTGGFAYLYSTVPPESSVAWTSFFTGVNPGKHGIFDFLQPDRDNYLPYLTLSKFLPPGKFLSFAGYRIPLSSPRLEKYWDSTPFWEITSKYRIPTVILRLPMTFPPEKLYGKMLSGFGVPDLLGTQGTYAFYTTRKLGDRGREERVVRVEENNGQVKTFIYGPENSFRKDMERVKIPLTFKINSPDREIVISLQGKSYRVKEGAWSKWIEVDFPLLPLARVKGILQFYVKKVKPDLEVYLSPLNFDPRHPAFPISFPSSYSRELSRAMGLFHTLGQPGETWALNEGRLGEQAVLEEYGEVLKENEKMLDYEMKRFREGILFCYFGITDITQHMFYRFLDPHHPLYNEKEARIYRDVIPRVYREMDRILGEVLQRIDKETKVIVLSDHGFSSFRKSINLNTWLWKEGYLSLNAPPQESEEFFQNVNWAYTRAYSLGIGGGIYLNLRGRESLGTVRKEDISSLTEEIKKKIEGLTCPENGEKVVNRVYLKEEVYSGQHLQEAPEIVVGFKKGYRVSWESALGAVRKDVFQDNKKKWSGDHCFDSKLVPGILFTNFSIEKDKANIVDVIPTVFRLLNIPVTGEMDGKSLVVQK